MKHKQEKALKLAHYRQLLSVQYKSNLEEIRVFHLWEQFTAEYFAAVGFPAKHLISQEINNEET